MPLKISSYYFSVLVPERQAFHHCEDKTAYNPTWLYLVLDISESYCLGAIHQRRKEVEGRGVCVSQCGRLRMVGSWGGGHDDPPMNRTPTNDKKKRIGVRHPSLYGLRDRNTLRFGRF